MLSDKHNAAEFDYASTDGFDDYSSRFLGYPFNSRSKKVWKPKPKRETIERGRRHAARDRRKKEKNDGQHKRERKDHAYRGSDPAFIPPTRPSSTECWEDCEGGVDPSDVDGVYHDDNSDELDWGAHPGDLWNQIERGDWDEVMDLLADASNHKQAEERWRWGYTCLDFACIRAAPAHVIRALLDASPLSALEQDRHSGMTPLSRSIQQRVLSDDVILMLIGGCSMAASVQDSHGQTPLHIAADAASCRVLEALIRAYPAALLQIDASGNTPLHRALYHGNSDGAVLHLMEACPQAVSASRERYTNGEYKFRDTLLNWALANDVSHCVVDALAKACPSAIPLACEIGRPLDEERVRAIYHSISEALTTRDINAHMLPFMVAATGTELCAVKVKRLDKLTATFSLLLADPTAVDSHTARKRGG